MPTGVYPYATPHSQYPGQPMPVPSSSRATTDAVAPERSATARYECNYCHKGFTRPSSLKVRTPESHFLFNSYRNRFISIHTRESGVSIPPWTVSQRTLT